jgi:hypothetical protein
MTLSYSGNTELTSLTSLALPRRGYHQWYSTMQIEEYLTVSELAGRLKLKPKTIKNKMASGIFEKGRHYFSPPGLGPRFKWSAVVDWLEEEHKPKADEVESIPMARGYKMGSSPTGSLCLTWHRQCNASAMRTDDLR